MGMSGLPARQRLQIARILWMTYPSLISLSLSRLERDCHHVWRVCCMRICCFISGRSGCGMRGQERLDASASAHNISGRAEEISPPAPNITCGSVSVSPSLSPSLSHRRRRCTAHFMQKRLFWAIINPEFMTSAESSLRVGGKFCTLGLELEQSRVFRFPRGKFAYGRKRAFSFLWCVRRP